MITQRNFVAILSSGSGTLGADGRDYGICGIMVQAVDDKIGTTDEIAAPLSSAAAELRTTDFRQV